MYVIVTDVNGQNDRASGSGTLYLPDGSQAALQLSEPGASSQYDSRVRFGSGQTLTDAQFTQTCAASLLKVSLTLPDDTGHVTIANDLWVAPTTGGTL